jgi:hypothetical protein
MKVKKAQEASLLMWWPSQHNKYFSTIFGYTGRGFL